MPYTANAGARLYWEEHGNGPPLLMIMGLSFTHEMWFRLLPCLASEYRVLTFDNRGVGRSDVPPGPYLIKQMADDARVVLDAAGVQAAHVIGASMGGMIALELAFRHPQRVQSLLLGCTTHSGLLSKWPNFSRRPRGVNWFRAGAVERERALIPMLYADATPHARIEEDLEIRSRCQWCYRGFVNQLAGILLWSAYRRLSRIRVPTLVVHGEQDRLVPPGNGRVLAARIPGARFHLVPNAGHILMTDQPAICTDLILSFLRQQHSSLVA